MAFTLRPWLRAVPIFLAAACSASTVPAPSPPGEQVREGALCPVTDARDRPAAVPASAQPPPADRFLYGSGDLWASVPVDGEITLGSFQGAFAFWWWSAVPGSLSVTAERIDGSAPVLTTTVDSEYRGYQITHLAFPGAGCWRVTGTRDGTRDTATIFVVRVTERASSADACASGPSDLRPDPRFPGTLSAQAGPFSFRTGYRSGQTNAVIDGFIRGAPTKVLIVPLMPLAGEVRLRGWRCNDQRVLTFAYGRAARGPNSTTEELERAGTSEQAFGPTTPGVTGDGVLGYAGYILFTSPGLWEVDVTDAGGRRVAFVTFLVAEGHASP